MNLEPLDNRWLEPARALEAHCFEDAWSVALWHRFLPQSYVLIAQDQLIGYAQCSKVLDEAELLRIAISPAYRRQGMGRQLLQQLCEQLRQQDIQRLMLEVRESNRAALALYQSCGFQLDGRRTGYYDTAIPGVHEDALLFGLDLLSLQVSD
ncbi:MAG: ribosomal protein S18-alanine N-acetyltransferase [Nitrincola lacisaponensis]|uniref:[Ribosomal protein bS18]-alanine N-acetyltransferase n=1 Tax=Nitrincola lacisaponensis TaxID=267850 RepID=A0A063Y491_9GAMM|nr:ribosomal protein S18-alanine N-acetyltransferase [Nitrincola lacisaponensis]KDE40464.1 Ribosomal-protein-S18p-alanine acetyltransferase [Nitrincola lacisaponensis]